MEIEKSVLDIANKETILCYKQERYSKINYLFSEFNESRVLKNVKKEDVNIDMIIQMIFQLLFALKIANIKYKFNFGYLVMNSILVIPLEKEYLLSYIIENDEGKKIKYNLNTSYIFKLYNYKDSYIIYDGKEIQPEANQNNDLFYLILTSLKFMYIRKMKNVEEYKNILFKYLEDEFFQDFTEETKNIHINILKNNKEYINIDSYSKIEYNRNISNSFDHFLNYIFNEFSNLSFDKELKQKYYKDEKNIYHKSNVLEGYNQYIKY